MSILQYAIPVPVQREGVLSALLRRVSKGRSQWGLADQILISGTNFVTMAFAARGLGVAGFGEFSLVYNVLLFVNMIQAATICQPHNVLGTGRAEGRDYQDYTTSTAMGQSAIIAVQTLIALPWLLLAHSRGWHCQGLLLALIPAMAAWALQEFFRRILYTEGRRAAAFANDLISYGGQAVWIISLWFLDIGKSSTDPHWLTGSSALWALAITSGVAAILGFLQVRKSLSGRFNFAVWVENWHFGKWLMGSEVLVYFSSLPMYMNLVGWLVGTSASGELKAAQTLFGPARIISYYLATVLPIHFAQRLAAGGNSALRQQFKESSLRVLPMVGAFCLLIALFPGVLIRIFFGENFAAHPSVVAMYAGIAFLAYIQMVISAALVAKQMTRQIFLATIGGAAATLVFSVPLVKWMGTCGALIAMLLTGMVITATLWHGYAKAVGGTDDTAA